MSAGLIRPIPTIETIEDGNVYDTTEGKTGTPSERAQRRRQSLFDAVLLNPAAKCHRVALARGLKKDGDAARSKFVFTQIELAKINSKASDPKVIAERARLSTIERELWAANGAKWYPPGADGLELVVASAVDNTKPLPAKVVGVVRRGLLHEVVVDRLSDWWEVGPVIVPRHPVEKLSIWFGPDGEDLPPSEAKMLGLHFLVWAKYEAERRYQNEQ